MRGVKGIDRVVTIIRNGYRVFINRGEIVIIEFRPKKKKLKKVQKSAIFSQ